MTEVGATGPGPGPEATDVLEAVVPALRGVRPPVDFHAGRVRRDRVLLDLAVHGAPLRFEVLPDGDGWRVVVMVREAVDLPVVEALGLPRVGRPQRLRFLVGRVPAREGSTLAATAVELCTHVLDRLAAAGPPAASRDLLERLAPDGPLVVVDVGANPLTPPPYARLLGLGACRVVGFEPQPEAFAQLQGKDPERELYLPHAVGTPGTHRLHTFRGSGFASMLAIDETTVELIGSDVWRTMTTPLGSVEVECTALDDVPGLPPVDLLKIDVQGGELAVFQSGRRALGDAFCVVPEVSFLPLYQDQPSFAEVHQELVAQGFLLHKFLFQKAVHLHGSQTDPGAGLEPPRNQLVDGDAVYLRDLRALADHDTEQVKKLVLAATFVFGSADVAVRALDELVRRGAVDAGLPASYAAHTWT